MRYTSLASTISDDNNTDRTSEHASTSWRSDGSPSCLGGSSRVGHRQNPQYTRAHFGGEAVGGSLALQHTTMSPRKRNTITIKKERKKKKRKRGKRTKKENTGKTQRENKEGKQRGKTGGKTVNTIHPAPDIHEHFMIHKGYGTLCTT